jgi:AAA15 family ATPase/GTPase
MIQYLKIRNFGPIKDEVELSFEATLGEELSDDIYTYLMPDGCRLLKLAYIYGANASGKTTILKVFEFLKELILKPLPDKSSAFDYQPFLFCADPDQNESFIELAFYTNKVRHIYTVTFNKEAVLNEKLVYFHTAKPTELFSRETDIDKRVAKIQFGSKAKVSAKDRDRLESNTLHNNTVLGAFTKTNADIMDLEVLNLWFSSFLLGIIDSNTNIIEETAAMITGNISANKWMDKFMNKADRQISKVNADKDKTFSGIRPLNPESTVRVGQFSPNTLVPAPTALKDFVKMQGGTNIFEFKRKIEFTHHTDEGVFVLPIDAESSGTQRYFSLGGPLYTLVHTPSFLLIDELETSLHPDLMKHFLQTFLANAEQSQMLITTHNIGLMEEIDFVRKDALWFSEKKTDGSADLYSAADFDSSILRKGASLINAYRAGKLGAKPNLGSPFIIQD